MNVFVVLIVRMLVFVRLIVGLIIGMVGCFVNWWL